MSRIKAAVAAVTIASATAAAMLVPSSPAVAFSSGGLVLDVKVQSPAQLVAKGAAVGVPVLYTCSGASSSPSLSVQVTERVSGGQIANGSGFVDTLTCTGEIQSLTVQVTAFSSRAFAKGSAVATADIFGCSSFCGDQQNSATITISK